MKTYSKIMILLTLLVLPYVLRAEIFIGNPSFDEGADVNEGATYAYDIAPWVAADGAYNWIGNHYYAGAPEGSAWYNVRADAIVYQELDATFLEGKPYKFSMDVGTYNNGTQYGENWTLFIYDATSGSYTDPLAQESGVLPGGGVWYRQSVKYIPSADTAGHKIGIGFTGDYYTLFDNATLEVMVNAELKSPADGATLVPVDTAFEWIAPQSYTPTKYDLEYRTDPNFANPGTVTVTDLSETSYTPPGGLAYNTTYYWRITTYGDTEPHTGPAWSFVTAPAIPLIQVQPSDQTVAAGTSVSFTCRALNATSYEWYYAENSSAQPKLLFTDTVAAPGDTSTYTIDNVTLDKEGYYSCKAKNDAGFDDSAQARLMTRHLVGYWPLDGDAEDAVGDNDGIIHGDPQWVEGVIGLPGSALQLSPNPDDPNLNDYVVLGTAESLEYRTTDFSVSIWVKTSGGNDQSGIISNKDWASGVNPGWVISTGNNTDSWQWNLSDQGDGRADYDPAGPQLEDGQWHMLCVTNQRDSVATFYFDGRKQAEVDISGLSGSLDSGYPTVVGSDGAAGANWAAWFNGTVDDIRIWNYVLDPYSVAKLYTDARPDDTFCVVKHVYDLNGDCKIDLSDLALLASTWLDCNQAPDCLNQHTIEID